MRPVLFILMSGLLMLPFANGNAQGVAVGSKGWKKYWASFDQGKWMMKTEVSNADYKLFLQWLKASGKEEEYEFFYPDSLGWNKESVAYEAYVSYYFSNPSFNDYPVVNITYEAAYDYCMWLTSEYDKLKEKPFGKVAFRIPTREEWMLAARSGKNDERAYPWNGMYLHNNRNERLCNYRAEEGSRDNGMPGKLSGKNYITVPVDGFFPNEIGLYNTSGNVAEMVAERGVAVGGSFLDDGYNVRIYSKKSFAKSEPDVGFRVLMYKVD